MKKLIWSVFFAGISLLANAQSNYELVTKISPPNPDPSGIAVSSKDRVFLGFPRHADNHKELALAEVVDGKLIPFPNKEYVYPGNNDYKNWLVSPHGMYIDKNDVLWVLDDGKRSGMKEIPEGAAKVVGIDINTKKILHTVIIPKPVLSDDAHYNDLRVDLSHGSKGTVYIANSGFGEQFSLVVLDVATGKAKEVLLNHYSTSPDPGFIAFLEGKPLKYDFKKQKFPLGGADGIAISTDVKTLYYTAISSRKLYSISTDLLSNLDSTEKQIEDAVKFEGERPACDGLAEDEKGNIYFGAFEQQSVVKRNSAGEFSVISHDKENYVWPDGLAYRNGYVYVTLGQWNRLPGFNDGKDLRKPPYLVVKIKTDKN